MLAPVDRYRVLPEVVRVGFRYHPESVAQAPAGAFADVRADVAAPGGAGAQPRPSHREGARARVDVPRAHSDLEPQRPAVLPGALPIRRVSPPLHTPPPPRTRRRPSWRPPPLPPSPRPPRP